MGGLQFHHQQQILMTPISFPCNLRAATTTLCLRSTLSNWFSTSCPKLCTSTSGKINAVNSGSAAELKEQWLNSLNCPPLLKETEPQIDQEATNVDSQWVIGIDPDVSGAMAVLKTYDLGSSAQVYDSPNVKVLIGNRIRRRMDTKAIVELLRSLSIPIGTTAYIEQSLPYPGDGKQGWWSGGFNYGLWIGILVASGVSVVPVPSMRWKQEFKLSGNGKTKDNSRALAGSLFPSLSSSLKRKKDHGRAEALLIAAYGKGIRLNSDSESLTSIDTGNNTS
ncbi:hypothetical protein L1987_19034 [Smallanthus sonchifolius]|uniref:Uncharacterized protein n=1 Tax=Smallanthus sonchifolius TaxID=185202 RepID=A0ACB9J1C9_9ASTR|nr:hypothetical protein L1987_19034 [Smallanthus sonchifolius]